MLAERMSRVSASPTMKVLAEAEKLRQQGVDVVDFGAGEPDFPTPEHVKAAGARGHRRQLHQLHAGGRHPRAAAGDLRRATSTTTASTTRPNEVIVTAGGKQALYNTALALFGPGDEVITHAPYWPTIPRAGQAGRRDAGHRRRPAPRTASRCTRRRDPRRRSRRRRTAIIINSPCNPTGALIDEARAWRRSPTAAAARTSGSSSTSATSS